MDAPAVDTGHSPTCLSVICRTVWGTLGRFLCSRLFRRRARGPCCCSRGSGGFDMMVGGSCPIATCGRTSAPEIQKLWHPKSRHSCEVLILRPRSSQEVPWRRGVRGEWVVGMGMSEKGRGGSPGIRNYCGNFWGHRAYADVQDPATAPENSRKLYVRHT